jgi:hypothetical protein
LLAFAMLVTLHCGGESQISPEVAGPRNLRSLDRVDDLGAQRTTYVPIYSSLHVADHAQPIDLGATLSLRNVSERTPVVLLGVDYYDSDGALVRSFLEQPAELGPLMSAEFFIARPDRAGGSGANFLVHWALREPGPDLLAEAVMHGRDGAAGVSFVSHGRVVESRSHER